MCGKVLFILLRVCYLSAMYQFITSITFEIVLILVFGIGYFIMLGKLRLGAPAADFEEWRLKNGRLIRSVCIMTVVVLLISVLSKYMQFTQEAGTQLQR